MIQENNELYRILAEAQCEDKKGRTPIEKFAQEAKKYHSENPKILKIKLWMGEIAMNIENLNFEQIQGFIYFFYGAEIKVKALFDILEIKLQINFLQDNLETIKKRAEILRFVVCNTSLFSAYQLEKEEHIKEKFPWYFVDCMIKRSIGKTIPFIMKLVMGEKDMTKFLIRLPSWKKELPEDCFKKIMEDLLANLKGDKRKKLEKWAKRKK